MINESMTFEMNKSALKWRNELVNEGLNPEMMTASASVGSRVDGEGAPRQTDGRSAVLRHRPADAQRCHHHRSGLLHGRSEEVRPRHRSLRGARTDHPGRTHLPTVWTPPQLQFSHSFIHSFIVILLHQKSIVIHLFHVNRPISSWFRFYLIRNQF